MPRHRKTPKFEVQAIDDAIESAIFVCLIESSSEGKGEDGLEDIEELVIIPEFISSY